MHTDTAFDDADLNGLVDGRIEPARASALAESLASDPDSAARIDAWRRQNDSLRTMFASVLAEPVPVRLLPVAVAQREAAKADAPGDGAPGRRLAGVVATTSIGMALIGFALGALASVGTDGFGLTPPAARAPAAAPADASDLAVRAAEAHRTYLTDASRPVEISGAEEPKLARWFGRRLGAEVRIPDLSRHGWTLLGGRIVPGRHGAAGFLAYGSGADRLGLTVSRGATPDDARLAASDDDAPPLGVATWTDGGIGYALTADRGPDWLRRNLAALRDSVKAQARAAGPEAASP